MRWIVRRSRHALHQLLKHGDSARSARLSLPNDEEHYFIFLVQICRMKKFPQNRLVDVREPRESLMLVKRDGAISSATPLGLQWICEYFGVKKDPERLPIELRRWLVDPHRTPGTCRPFAKENREARLVVSLLRDETDSRFALLIEKHSLNSPRTRLRHHGVTKRENQVLALMASDKTNNNIAKSLGIAGSTVKRHVEHIFEKYGVRTRAAAVAVWQQTAR